MVNTNKNLSLWEYTKYLNMIKNLKNKENTIKKNYRNNNKSKIIVYKNIYKSPIA